MLLYYNKKPSRSVPPATQPFSYRPSSLHLFPVRHHVPGL